MWTKCNFSQGRNIKVWHRNEESEEMINELKEKVNREIYQKLKGLNPEIHMV